MVYRCYPDNRVEAIALHGCFIFHINSIWRGHHERRENYEQLVLQSWRAHVQAELAS